MKNLFIVDRAQFIIALLLCLNSISCGAQDVVPLFPCTSTMENPYGVTAHFGFGNWDYPYQEGMLKRMQEAGIGMVRHDYLLTISKDTTNYNNAKVLERATAHSVSYGIGILPILTRGDKGNRPWENRDGYNIYLKYLLQHYGNRIHYWEAMNEVNLLKDGMDKNENVKLAEKGYASILPQIYKSIKSFDPNAKVLLSGLSDVYDGFLEEICKYSTFNYFDILNFHSYCKPEELIGSFEKISSIMKSNNWHKPVWITECGMHTADDSILHQGSLRVEEQAHRVARIYLISFAYGVDKVFWYNLRSQEINPYYSEDNLGLLHADLSPKPAFIAYKALTKMCPSGSTRPTLHFEEGVYLSSWKRLDGKRVWAIWNTSGKKAVNLNVSGRATYYNYLGEKINVAQKRQLDIDGGVTYIVGGKNISIK